MRQRLAAAFRRWLSSDEMAWDDSAPPKGKLVGVVDEYGTVWAGLAGQSKVIGDLIYNPDHEEAVLYLIPEEAR